MGQKPRMTETQKPSTALTVVAALSALMAFPAAVVVLLVIQRGDVARAFVEGGSFTYLTVAAFSFAVLAIGGCAAFVPRVRLPAAIPFALAVLPSMLGGAGMALGFRGVRAAVANVNPADKATILAAGLSEALQCVVIGVALSGAAWLAVALSFGLAGAAAPQGAVPPRRPAAWVAATAAFGLALAAWVEAAEWRDVLTGFQAVATVNPVDKAAILGAVFQEHAEAMRLRWGLLGATAVSVVVVALLTRAKPSPVRALAAGAVVAASVWLPSATVEANSRIEAPSLGDEALAPRVKVPSSVRSVAPDAAFTLEASEVLHRDGAVLVDDGAVLERVKDDLRRVAELHAVAGLYAGETIDVPVEPLPNIATERVLHFMQLAFRARANQVSMCGAPSSQPEALSQVPEGFRSLVVADTVCFPLRALKPDETPAASLVLGPNGFTLEPEAAVTKDALVLATPQGELQAWLEALAVIEAKGAVAVLRTEE